MIQVVCQHELLDPKKVKAEKIDPEKATEKIVNLVKNKFKPKPGQLYTYENSEYCMTYLIIKVDGDSVRSIVSKDNQTWIGGFSKTHKDCKYLMLIND